MDRNTKLVYQIDKLVQINMDRMLLFKKAHQLVNSRVLKDFFEQCICQSETYGSKLKLTMLFHGVKLESKPSVIGRIFRGWMQSRTIFTKNKNVAVLKSCLEVEKMTSLSYDLICQNRFLKYYYPLLKYTFLRQQFALKQAREHLESTLRDEQTSVFSLMPAESGSL